MSPIEQYAQLEQSLAGLIGKVKFSASINLRLERITRLLAIIGNPHLSYPVIHVGGTSGKGSTATMIAAILTQVGYRTGLHSSPHLQLFNERHQINGEIAPTSLLWSLYQELMPAIEQVGVELPEFGRPSYFEAQFALSALCFARQKVDVAVIEVGLGGRVDATNVVQSSVAVLTNVGLDHTEILGHTIEEIITDKSGIIKPNQIVVTGVTQPSAHAIVAEKADSCGNPLWSLGKEISYEGSTLHLGYFDLSDLKLGMGGAFQYANATCAAAAALAFDPQISAESVRLGLEKATLPARMELLQKNPVVLLDGAHNPDKMHAAAAAFEHGRGKTIVVIALKDGKDKEAILQQLLPHADEMIATQFEEKGLWLPISAELIVQSVQQLTPQLPITAIPNPIEAVRHALARAHPEDTIWITGSLYLAGDVRELWYSREELIDSAEKSSVFFQ